MRLGKYVSVGVSDLFDPQARPFDEENIKALILSMEIDGLIAPIVVVGNKIMAGVHRWQAAKRLRWESMAAIDVTGLGAEEVARIILAENHCRRQWEEGKRQEQLAQLVAIKIPVFEKKLNENHDTPNFQHRGIRPNPATPKSEAIKAVAHEKKVTESSVRKAVDRRALVAERVQRKQAEALAKGDTGTFDELGHAVPPERAEWYTERRKLLNEISRHTIAAAGLVTKLIALDGGNHGQFGDLTHYLTTAGREARDAMPFAVCPKCGGTQTSCKRLREEHRPDPSKPTPFSCTTGFIHQANRKRFEQIAGAA